MKPSYLKKSLSKFTHSARSGFTLLELIVVIGIVAILGIISVLVLNPAQIFKQTRDANRVSDLQNINRAMIYYQASGGSSFGSASTIYVSLPDSSATCANLGLPNAPVGWAYACQPTASYRNVDGTGWIPVDFTTVQQTVGALFSTLPIDPVNTLSGDYYYTYIVGSWTLSATMESTKYLNSSAADDGGVVSTRFETGNDLALNSNITSGGGLSNAKAITVFSFASPAATGVITGTDIAVTVPNGTTVTALTPTITISALASVSPLSGAAQNFTSPVTYTVTAENSTTQEYIVTVTVAPAGFAATGGTITTSGGYTIHTFTTGGTFTVTEGSGDVEVLVVGGGGGGAAGGGGGSGAVRTATIAVTTQAYSVTVGSGGGGAVADSWTNGTKGNDSVFSTLTSEGGGYGAHQAGMTSGGSGGSGGGGGYGGAGGLASAGGNIGGGSVQTGNRGSGGGGGAGAVGAAGTTTGGGNGGNGIASSISGVSVTYGGGGGGGNYSPSNLGTNGTGGTGGGGAAGAASGSNNQPGVSGTVNTGGGGGGGAGSSAGGSGGSGIVIVRYLTP